MGQTNIEAIRFLTQQIRQIEKAVLAEAEGLRQGTGVGVGYEPSGLIGTCRIPWI